MQGPLSDRINNLQESATIKMAQLSRELSGKGVDVISLSLGEPDFGTPEHIGNAAKRGIDEGYTKYMPVPGYMDLREAISAKFKRDNNLDYPASQIVVSTGAKQTLANLMLSLVNPGDEVILPIPYWVSYAAQVRLAEGVVKEVPSGIDNDFKITPEALEAAIGPKTRAFLFSSPCNPTGTVYTKEELEALANVLAKHPHIYIIADEIYEWINFTGQHASIGQFANVKDQVITVNGVSKGFAMTGWRVGYMGAPPHVAKACSKMQGQFTSGTSSISQRAVIEALTGDMAPTHKMKDAFLKRKQLVRKLLLEIPGLKVNDPQGAFYFFPDVTAYLGKSFEGKKMENVKDLCMYILNEGHVSVVPGSAFGDPDCFRISYASSEEVLSEAMKRIKGALEKLA